MAWQGLQDIFGGIAQFEKNRQDREVMRSILGDGPPTAAAGPGTAGVSRLKPTVSPDDVIRAALRLHDPRKAQQVFQLGTFLGQKAKPTGRWLEEPDAEGRPSILRHSLTGDIKADPRAATGKTDDFTLSPGQVRFDAQGNIVARGPAGGKKLAGPVQAYKDARSEGIIPDDMSFAQFKSLGRPETKISLTQGDKLETLLAQADAFDAEGKTDLAQATRMKAYGEPNAEEMKNYGFANRMYASEAILSEIDSVGADPVQTVRSFFGNLATTPIRRRYEQARRDFINAVLRRESGAVIAASEFADADRQYFPQIGDDAATIEQKRRNRLRTAKDIRKGALRANLIYGVPTVPSIVPGQTEEQPSTASPRQMEAGGAADAPAPTLSGMFGGGLPGGSVGLTGLSIPAAPDAPPAPAPVPTLVPGGAAQAGTPALAATGLTAPPAPEATTDPAADLRAMSEADFLALATQVKQNPGAFPAERMILLADEWERRKRARR